MNVITRLTSVLLPEPLDPTSAVVDPAGARKLTCLSTGTPGSYSNDTSSNTMSPRTGGNGSRRPSSASSVTIRLMSRIRSRPASASVICVPIAAICTRGAASRPMKKTYMTKSPSVIVPDSRARPPTRIITTPIAPMITLENAVTADTPVIDRATLRNSRCTPCVNTRCSRFSAMYALTTRMPPSDSASRPVTSALIRLRSRNSGRSRVKANAIPPPNAASTTMLIEVSCQLR